MPNFISKDMEPKFTETFSSVEFRNYVKQHMPDQSEATERACRLIEAYIRGTLNNKISGSEFNFLICGDDANAKKEFYQTIKNYFEDELKAPFHILLKDVSFVQLRNIEIADLEKIVDELNPEDDYAIIFLDGIDRVHRKFGGNNNKFFNEGENQEIFTCLLEGRYLKKDNEYIDTSHILFIGLGRFAGIEDVTYENLLAWGLSKQLLARFTDVISFHSADKVHKAKMIWRTVEKFSLIYPKYHINASPKYVQEVMWAIANNPLGCQAIKSIVWRSMARIQEENIDNGSDIILTSLDTMEIRSERR